MNKPLSTKTVERLIEEDEGISDRLFYYWFFLSNETPDNIRTYSRRSMQVFFANMLDLEDNIWFGADISNNFLKGAKGYT